MKILHTSDWHIGRNLANTKFYDEFNFFIDFLVDFINENKIDVLLIAGDIFDNAFPSNTALATYFSALKKITGTSLKQIIIIGGNHDSPSTLDAPKEILEEFNIKIISAFDPQNIDNHIIEIPSENPRAVICALPYPREREIKALSPNEEFDSRDLALKKRISSMYEILAKKIKNYKNRNIPVFATGHLFINETSVSDSEREDYIGGLTAISYKLLPQTFDLYLLGHVHKFFVINKKFIYSGSPFAMNFDENNKKSFVLIDINENNFSYKKIDIPLFREKMLFRGDLKSIENQLNNFLPQGKLKPIAILYIENEKESHLIIKQKIQEFRQNFTKKIDIIDYRIITDMENFKFNYAKYANKNIKDISPKEIFEGILEKNQNKYNEEDQNNLREIFDEILREVKENEL